VLWGAFASAFVLVAFGVLLHFVGFRIAIEFSPSLARSLGGVTTEAEQQKLEATYRDSLDELRQSMKTTLQEIRQLETLKNQFMDIATPSHVRDKYPKKEDAKGGPWIQPRFQVNRTQPLHQELATAQDEFTQTQAALKSMSKTWSVQLNWLNALPTGIPIGKDHRVTSGFGIRNDPFTGQLAMHEGLDFVADHGTGIMATAAGTVTRSAWDAAYGNIVEISHLEGFTTRYAHLSQRMVQEGQKVQRGEVIARLGSTGRSTGPHLHYEVMRHDRVLNPMQILMQASANPH
jgi:hypothetical protein